MRVIHNMSESVSQQVAIMASDLGGATRLVAASPFGMTGKAIDALCSSLGLSEVFVHSHEAGTVRGNAGANWPVNPKTRLHPVRMAMLVEENSRPLHAKMFEVVCKQGRLVVSGSANATSAAMDSNHNIEACVVRVHRTATPSWIFRRVSRRSSFWRQRKMLK